MIRFLSVLMVVFFVLIQSVPAIAATELILVPAPILSPNDTYANAWAAAGSPNTVDPPCGALGRGLTGRNGVKVTCGPKSKQVGTDSAVAFAEAKIVGGTATADAWVNVPKPTVFAAGAAYAKANASIPASDAAGGLLGMNITVLTKGNLKLSGQAEPIDVSITHVLNNDNANGLLPDLTRVLDEQSVGDLDSQGFTFTQTKTTKEYYRLEISLIGDEEGKIRIKRKFFSSALSICEPGYESEKVPCIIEQSRPLSEKDFENSCEGLKASFRKVFTKECGQHAVERESTRDVSVTLFIPFTGMEESLSLHELVCSKSREPHDPRPIGHKEICSLNLHAKQK